MKFQKKIGGGSGRGVGSGWVRMDVNEEVKFLRKFKKKFFFFGGGVRGGGGRVEGGGVRVDVNGEVKFL